MLASASPALDPAPATVRKLLRLLLDLYYRALSGRRFPGSATLSRRVGALEARSGRGDVPLPRALWEEQYRGGVWSYLDAPGEVARYGVVAGAVSRFAPAGAVLDVGCGEGVLVDYLRPAGPGSYLGIDLSQTAVAAAARRRGGAVRFAVADAEGWPLRGTFAAVVLNECLYYMRDPLAVTRRALAAVAPGGILVVSMFRTPRTRGLARLLARELPLLEEVVLSSRGGTWIVGLYRHPEKG